MPLTDPDEDTDGYFDAVYDVTLTIHERCDGQPSEEEMRLALYRGLPPGFIDTPEAINVTRA